MDVGFYKGLWPAAAKAFGITLLVVAVIIYAGYMISLDIKSKKALIELNERQRTEEGK